ADTRHSRRAPQFERRTIVGTAAPSCPAERSSAHCSALLSAISKKTSVEEGRPRPSRFEHWRASKFPSRHFKPPRDGGLVRPDEPHLRSEGSGAPREAPTGA